ncbi:MAG TPA: alpha/beta hydrolase [Terriglobia bacterium]|nr:alpha/beta hydrolase [Terriglobia bacterium]
MRRRILTVVVSTAIFTAIACPSPPHSSDSARRITIRLWPHGAPGEKGNAKKERDTTTAKDPLVAGRRVIRLTNITDPALTIYKPSKNTGTAIIVFPGGAYRILAMDLEGTEVCAWLNSIGVTGILLKYRVPPQPGVARYKAPLEDAQRAVGFVRDHARQWDINPNRIGVLGFSAGGNLAALLSNHFGERTYKPVDSADQVSCRPDFALLIYPAYLVDEKPQGFELAPEIKVTPQTPPTFLVQAEDDPVHVENSVFYFLALKDAKVPAEMHLYAKGGHGYGLRHTAMPVTGWPALAEKWLHTIGVI